MEVDVRTFFAVFVILTRKRILSISALLHDPVLRRALEFELQG